MAKFFLQEGDSKTYNDYVTDTEKIIEVDINVDDPKFELFDLKNYNRIQEYLMQRNGQQEDLMKKYGKQQDVGKIIKSVTEYFEYSHGFYKKISLISELLKHTYKYANTLFTPLLDTDKAAYSKFDDDISKLEKSENPIQDLVDLLIKYLKKTYEYVRTYIYILSIFCYLFLHWFSFYRHLDNEHIFY